MNITHAIDEKIEGDKLEAIFNRQKELMEKYHDIEARSGLMQTEDCPINLDDKRGQLRIKDFAWRVTEEIGEAIDALNQNDLVHAKEEFIDGLHFLTELTILSGYSPLAVVNYSRVESIEKRMSDGEDLLDILYNDIYRFYNNGVAIDNPKEILWDFVANLGMMCNCLKNKPWKQTNMITDKEAYIGYLSCVWSIYFRLLHLYFDSSDEIANVYLKKSQVNKFRQRSNY